MAFFFERRDRWGNRYSTWLLALLFFTILPLCVYSLLGIKMENNVENWLPKADPQTRLLSWYRGNFPVKERTIVSWGGSTLDDPRILALKEKLEGIEDHEGIARGGNKFVAQVTTPHDILKRFMDQKVEGEEGLKRLQGILIGAGPLKVRLTESGRAQKEKTIASLRRAIHDQLKIEIEERKSLERWEPPIDLLEDEEGAEEVLPVEFPYEIPEIPEHDFRLTWKGFQPESETVEKVIDIAKRLKGRTSQEHPDGAPLVEDCFLSVGSPIAMVVDFSEAGKLSRKDALHSIRLAAIDVGIPEPDFHLGGRSVGAETLNQEVVRAVWNKEAPLWNLPKRSVLILSGLVGAILSFLVMRSVRLAVFVLIVSYYTMIATVAIVPATGGTMNMVLVVMPTLLLVLTLSGAIHVANYWKHAALEDRETAVKRAYEMAKQPCLLASLTTAIGLASLATSSLFPVRFFGIYSAVGCFVSVFMVLVGLPSLIQLFGGRTTGVAQSSSSGAIWNRLGTFLSKSHVLVTLICVLVFIGGTAGLIRFRTETKVIRYFSESSRIVQDYRKMEENVVGIISIDTIIRFDEKSRDKTKFVERLELIRKVKEKIRNHVEVSGALSLADFLPVQKPRPSKKSFAASIGWNKKSHEIQRRALEGDMPSASQFVTIAKEEANWTTEDNLPFCQKGDELWRISAQGYLLADNDYQVLLKEIDVLVGSVCKNDPGARHVVTGMVPVFLRTQQAVLESLIYSFALAFGVIAIIMMILLQNPLAGLITMLPNLLPVGVVFGLISWFGWRVDVGTMITASVALGIAVDGTLHLLTWFREGLREGKTQEQSIQQALMHCGPAMCQTSGIVAIGLLMLAPAELLLISRFGCLMATLVATALIADLIFLPSLLAGPLGRLIESTVNKNRKGDSENQSDEGALPVHGSDNVDSKLHIASNASHLPLEGNC